MTAWHTGPMQSWDLETTAPDPEIARIVTASTADIGPGRGPITREWLANPGVPIPDEAAAIHGITTAIAQERGDDPVKVLTELVATLAWAVGAGMPLVIFNAPYDCTVLDRETRRHGLPPFADVLAGARVIDPLVIDKALDRYRPGKRTLTAACEHYRVRLDGAHDASFDALAAARLAWRFGHMAHMSAKDLQAMYAGRRHPAVLVRSWRQLGGMSLEDLHAAQVRWYTEQSESFAAYLRREREELRIRADEAQYAPSQTLLDDIATLDARIDAIDGSWPIRPVPAEATR